MKTESTIDPAGCGVDSGRLEYARHLRHELRTPLNAILGYSELLLEIAEEHHDTKSARTLEDIASAGKQIMTLIDRLIDSLNSSGPGQLEAGSLRVLEELRYAQLNVQELAARLRNTSISVFECEPDIRAIELACEKLGAISANEKNRLVEYERN